MNYKYVCKVFKWYCIRNNKGGEALFIDCITFFVVCFLALFYCF